MPQSFANSPHLSVEFMKAVTESQLKVNLSILVRNTPVLLMAEYYFMTRSGISRKWKIQLTQRKVSISICAIAYVTQRRPEMAIDFV